MLALVVARELAVDAIRAFAYARGQSFPATWPGKVKTALQSASVGVALLFLSFPTLPALLDAVSPGLPYVLPMALMLIAFLIGLLVLPPLLRRGNVTVIVER